MATQQNQSGNRASLRIPVNASQSQASQIVGYDIGDVVKLGPATATDQSSGGTSTGNTPNSTHSPGMPVAGSEMANINAGHSSGNTARIPEDSHQASMANASESQLFKVSRYDAEHGLFWAHKLYEDGTRDPTEVPLAADENYQVVTGH